MGRKAAISLTIMEKIEFELKGEYIELNKLLKASSLVATGGEAGMLILDGLVKVNGESCIMKRKKIRKGNTVQLDDVMISII
jgi:ribosome-associated protein